MLCFPNCKINIGLYITQKRADGYHDIETVFYPVQLRDVLEIVPAATDQMHMSGLAVSGGIIDNLVWKALQLLRTLLPGKIPSVDIYLHKAIPMGAGLGGGSADGAFMLQLLNNYFKLQLTKEQLAQYALHLGSDCPFFIYNTPQFASGRGEKLSAVSPDLSAYSLQLICPEVHVSTAQAFSMIRPQAAPVDLKTLPSIPVEQWKDKVRNDFELPVFEKHTELSEIKKQLYEQGAIYASMSGSGSALYGIFPKGLSATINANVAFKDFFVE
jgi:4-diphosphocytidyl-2-C-methyl-D-erythritol kinase